MDSLECQPPPDLFGLMDNPEIVFEAYPQMQMSGWCRRGEDSRHFLPNVRFRRGQIRESRRLPLLTRLRTRETYTIHEGIVAEFGAELDEFVQVLFLLVSSWREKTQGRRIFQAAQDFCAVLWRWWHVRKRTAQFLLAIRLLQNVTCRLNVAVIQVEIQNPPISLTAASLSP